jgi:glycosyltransferase involved in cell wall biosynthesis
LLRPRYAIVYGGCWDRLRAGRTLRALRLLGVRSLDLVGSGAAAVLQAMRERAGPLLLLRSGTWPVRLHWPAPPPSASGRPLLALGAAHAIGVETPTTAAWGRALRDSGGDFEGRALPPLASAFLDATLVASAAASGQGDVEAAVRAAASGTRARVVRVPGLDVFDDDGLRAAEVVTSLQQGGAERLAVELTTGLAECGVATRLVALGSPSRPRLQAPSDTLDMSERHAADAKLHRRAVGAELIGFGADVVHVHLLDRTSLRRLGHAGFPVVVTLHNTPEAWPAGMRELLPGEATLLVACAQAVERHLREAGLPGPHRTVWNGIAFDEFRQTARVARRHDLVLLAVANARPQKRLWRLPAILAATRATLRRVSRRDARLVVAGAAGPSASSHAELRLFAAEVERLRLAERVELKGSVADMPAEYACADVLVSPSAHEGLSLAQVEALASGLRLVATSVGGTAELAHQNPAVALVARDADAGVFAERIVASLQPPPVSGRDAARRDFSKERMCEGYARLLKSSVRAARRPAREGLLLVTNNFSTGGAQSSARRLLVGLHAQRRRVRAAVLQEEPRHPTPGRRALLDAGIPVLAVPPPERIDAAGAVERLQRALDDDPPEAVLLWNVIPEHKLLLADSLLDIPIFDASPGEMYFESLARYFERPRPGLPYRAPADYGARLAGVIVKYSAEAARAAMLGAPVHVVRNGVALRERRAHGSRNGHLAIGTLARLDPRKHVDRLLRALQRAHPRLPAYALLIAGAPERGGEAHLLELRRLAEGLPVEFVGDQPADAFLDSLDVFALVAEPAGCPNASLEAMAAGLPVIATDAGGMAEQIEDGKSGRLVPRADERALAEALLDVAADRALRDRLGAAARERVAQRFSLAGMVEAYAGILFGSAQSRG